MPDETSEAPGQTFDSLDSALERAGRTARRLGRSFTVVEVNPNAGRSVNRYPVNP